jgi:hypothetical protein
MRFHTYALVLGTILGFVVSVWMVSSKAQPVKARAPEGPMETGPQIRFSITPPVVLRRSRPIERRIPKAPSISSPRPEPPTSFEDATSRFAGEIDNAQETENLMAYLGSVAGSLDAGLEAVQSVQCRQTVCRLDLDMARLPMLQKSQQVLSADGYRFFSAVRRTDAGTMSAVAYIVSVE